MQKRSWRNLEKVLMILEVSRKQEYIFASKKLRENASRSDDIRYVTSSAFFGTSAGALYREEEHLVYAGGGHAVLQFDGTDLEEAADKARAFARVVTETVLREYDGLELFVKQAPYAPHLSPGENLKKLMQALEVKKSRRQASFRRMSFGLEALDPISFLPAAVQLPVPRRTNFGLRAPNGWEFPAEFETLAGKDNFIAVVHIDGNAMGKRVDRIYQANRDWEKCRRALDQFSTTIQRDFERVFLEMVNEVIRWRGKSLSSNVLPLRPVILAGDDVCFVTAGNIGLECARIFLERLAALRAGEAHPYAACAGVVLTHKKFPFHQAYDLSEKLCGKAKQYGAQLDSESRVSAMDWHIEFGQLKNSVEEIRADYQTEDGGQLELRPVTVVVPSGCSGSQKPAQQRSYSFFRQVCRSIRAEKGRTGRGKIKTLRDVLKQGELETEFFLHDRQIGHLLAHTGQAAFQPFEERGRDGVLKTVRRCLLFDAIELMDHCEFEEGAQ